MRKQSSYGSPIGFSYCAASCLRIAGPRAGAGRRSTRARTSSSMSATAWAAAMTSMRACSPATWASTSRAIRPCAEEHGGRRQPAARQLALQGGAQGRHRVRHHRPRHRFRSAARQQGGTVRRTEVHLDRQRQQRGEHLRRLAHVGHDQIPGPADARAGRRRHQRVRRHRSVPEDRQRRARDQDASRHRLSGRQRGRARHGARRGAGPLRLVMVERESHAPGNGIDQKKFAVLVQLALGKHADLPTCRSITRSGQDRRAPAGPQADLRPPGDGAAVPGAARHSGTIASKRCARRSSTRSPTRISWPIPTRRSWRSTRSRARRSSGW